MWPLFQGLKVEGRELSWRWNVKRLKWLARRGGAYLLRSNVELFPTNVLWRQYVQLTGVEARVMEAFLGNCLWVCLKAKGLAAAPSLTPARVLEVLGGKMMVEAWFRRRDGRNLCLPRYTQPETEQALILRLLGTYPNNRPRGATRPPSDCGTLCGQPRLLCVLRSPANRPLLNPPLLKVLNPD